MGTVTVSEISVPAVPGLEIKNKNVLINGTKIQQCRWPTLYVLFLHSTFGLNALNSVVDFGANVSIVSFI